jgi:hypothetical protein
LIERIDPDLGVQGKMRLVPDLITQLAVEDLELNLLQRGRMSQARRVMAFLDSHYPNALSGVADRLRLIKETFAELREERAGERSKSWRKSVSLPSERGRSIAPKKLKSDTDEVPATQAPVKLPPKQPKGRRKPKSAGIPAKKSKKDTE